MIFEETSLPGSFIIHIEPIEDERGFFSRVFCTEEFLKKGLNAHWAQINNSFSKNRGTLRGPHIQSEPHEEVKLVRCIKGRVWDVIIDLRQDSNSFGEWYGAILDSRERKMIYIPKGFAHAVLSMSNESEIIYLTSTPYSNEHEVCLLWNDPDIGIKWPVTPQVMSEKESLGITLSDYKISNN